MLEVVFSTLQKIQDHWKMPIEEDFLGCYWQILVWFFIKGVWWRNPSNVNGQYILALHQPTVTAPSPFCTVHKCEYLQHFPQLQLNTTTEKNRPRAHSGSTNLFPAWQRDAAAFCLRFSISSSYTLLQIFLIKYFFRPSLAVCCWEYKESHHEKPFQHWYMYYTASSLLHWLITLRNKPNLFWQNYW